MSHHQLPAARRTPRSRRTLAVLAAFATLLGACRGERADPRAGAPSAADTARRIASLDSARWTVAEDAHDSTLGDAVAMAADDSTVYVLADGGRRLVALDGSRGSLRWMLPGRGADPLVPIGATAIARTALGNLALLDGRARVVAIVGAEGRPRETISLGGDGEPTRLCAREGGGFVVAGGDPQGRLVALAPDGAFEWTLVPPWPGADTLGALRLQSVLASSPSGRACVAALRLGYGFTSLRASTPPVMSAHPFLEPVAMPAVRTVRQQQGTTTTTFTMLDDAPAAAADVAVAGDMVLVAFEGATTERRRLVDLYRMSDGRYAGTLLHRSPVVGIAAWDQRLYVLHRVRGRFALDAWDVPALRDGVDAAASVRSLSHAGAAPPPTRR
jgi:hypothetical protein